MTERPRGGRRQGARNRLSTDFLENLAEDFAQHGPNVIKIVRADKPVEYLRLVAGCLPREFEITDSRLKELSDAELDILIDEVRTRIADRRTVLEDTPRREGETLN